MNQFSYCLNNPINMVDYGGNKPGDLFDTMDDAAIDAAKYLGALSWESGWEYATSFYTKKKTVVECKVVTTTHRFLFWSWTTTEIVPLLRIKTFYTYKAVKTDKTSDSVHIPNAPIFKKRVGALHTHPLGSWVGLTIFSDRDKQFAKQHNIPLYVHGPNGVLRKYDPVTDRDIIICSDLPTSHKKPWLN